ncbi:MAG: tail fiber domain-containing protein, partial [Chitinophagales bacterium]|nr:tail fiber domain-containing protein [Chitinophagales bacterium]
GLWVFTTGGIGTREYIEQELSNPLDSGILYSVSFYVSRAEYSRYASDRIGVYFSKDSITSTTYLNLPVIPQVENQSGNILTDTLNWTLISNQFIAEGGEKFITIGNFRDETQTQWIDVNPLSGWGSKATADNYGVYGSATADGSAAGTVTNYGVYENASGGDVNYAGYFSGNAHVTGNLTVAGNVTITGTATCTANAWTPSDSILKDNVVVIENASDILSKLDGFTYNFDTLQFPQLHLPSGDQLGLIAQQVKEVIPSAVKEFTIFKTVDSSGNIISPEMNIQAINYHELIPVLISGHRDQQLLIDKMQQQINDLQTQLDGCCGGGMKMKDPNDPQSQTVNLVTKEQIQLGNCAPNPNGGQTVIPFHLPQSVVKAEMVFTDMLGQEVIRVELNARGFNQINVTTTQLEDGTYNYTLIADNKVIGTKQMIKQH